MTTDSSNAIVEPSVEGRFADNMETIAPDESGTEQNNSTSAIDEAVEQMSKRAFYTKLIVGLVFVSFVVFVIVDSVTNMRALNALYDFLDWVEENPVEGVFAFIGVYFLATVLFIPASLLTLGSGFVFAVPFGLAAGVALAATAVFIAASLGAIVSFLLGRYLLRRQMQKLTKKYVIFEAIDAALEKNGVRIFLLLRLSPIVPFNVINYVAGVTSVSLRDYTISLLGILPGTLLYVFLGASAASLADSATSGGKDPTVTVVVSVVGAVFGILAIALTTRYAKRELDLVLEERRLSGGEEGRSEEKVEDEATTHINDSAPSTTDIGGTGLASIEEDISHSHDLDC